MSPIQSCNNQRCQYVDYVPQVFIGGSIFYPASACLNEFKVKLHFPSLAALASPQLYHSYHIIPWINLGELPA